MPKYRNSRDEIALGLAEMDSAEVACVRPSRTMFLVEANALPEDFGGGTIRVVVGDNLSDEEIAEYGNAYASPRGLQRYIRANFSFSVGCGMFRAAIAECVDLPSDDVTRDPGAWYCGVEVLPPCHSWWQSCEAIQFRNNLVSSILEVS